MSNLNKNFDPLDLFFLNNRMLSKKIDIENFTRILNKISFDLKLKGIEFHVVDEFFVQVPPRTKQNFNVAFTILKENVLVMIEGMTVYFNKQNLGEEMAIEQAIALFNLTLTDEFRLVGYKKDEHWKKIITQVRHNNIWVDHMELKKGNSESGCSTFFFSNNYETKHLEQINQKFAC